MLSYMLAHSLLGGIHLSKVIVVDTRLAREVVLLLGIGIGSELALVLLLILHLMSLSSSIGILQHNWLKVLLFFLVLDPLRYSLFYHFSLLLEVVLVDITREGQSATIAAFLAQLAAYKWATEDDSKNNPDADPND